MIGALTSSLVAGMLPSSAPSPPDDAIGKTIIARTNATISTLRARGGRFERGPLFQNGIFIVAVSPNMYPCIPHPTPELPTDRIPIHRRSSHASLVAARRPLRRTSSDH
jgi:hypothetical protein